MASDIVTNRKAFRDYQILEKFEAGISLLGTEVKSLRAGRVDLLGCYLLFRSAAEIFIVIGNYHKSLAEIIEILLKVFYLLHFFH